MTPQELAARLHGREYGKEITKAEAAAAKAAGLVVVYGYSDDNVELEGAIDDEVGAIDGTTLRVTPQGRLQDWESLIDSTSDEDAYEEYFRKKVAGFKTIEAVWCPKQTETDTEPFASWAFKTTIPHATFDVMEDGELFCRGIVFALADVALPVRTDDPASLAQRLGALLADGALDQPTMRSAAADLLPRVRDFLRGLTLVATAEEPTGYVDRMRAEHTELAERLEKLCTFCSAQGGIFDSPPTEEKQRLTEQEGHMAAYLRVLGERIEAAS